LAGRVLRHRPGRQRELASTAAVAAAGRPSSARCLFSPPNHSSECLTVAPDRLSFGEVWEDSRFNWSLPVENRSGQDILIDNFVSSCTCSAVEPRSLTIPAGETRRVTLTLDLSAKSGARSPPVREFELLLAPQIREGPHPPPRWVVRGQVRTAFRVTPPALDFDSHSELAQPLAPRTIRVECLVPIDSLSATCDSPRFRPRVSRSPDDPHQIEVAVVPVTALEQGPFRCAVTLTARTAEGQQLPGKTVVIGGRIIGDVQTAPSEVQFGALPIGEVAEELVALESLAGRRFEVTGADKQGEGLEVTAAPNAPVAGPCFLVRQRVVGAGDRAGRVTFKLRSPERGAFTVTLDVRYYGSLAQR
jgi:hypothetical protein